MTAEQRPGIPQLIRRTLEGTIPFLRDHKVSVEQAKRSLEFAWLTIGGDSGRDVTDEQIHAVLQAELRVLQTSWFLNFSTSFIDNIDKKFLQDALKLHTVIGRNRAGTYMFTKADYWIDLAFKENDSSPNSQTWHEFLRRSIACEVADKFLLGRNRPVIGEI